MRRPGVDYWAHSPPPAPPPPLHSTQRPSASSSSGPPSLSHTSTADFYVPSEDAPPSRADHAVPHSTRAHASPSQFPPPPPPPSAAPSASPSLTEDDDGLTRRELERARRQVSLLHQQRAEAEDRANRLHAARAQDAVEHASTLRTVQATLEREQSLRMAAEGERQSATSEAHQLRAALRALLAQPPSHTGGDDHHRGGASIDSAPLTLYTEARNLLLHCERTFHELKMLQLKAVDAAGLERLRVYDVPVLDGIPPAWPPDTPQKGGRGGGADSSITLLTPSPVAGMPTVAVGAGGVEETPTGPEVSALTTVSPDTPSSPCVPQRSPSRPGHREPLKLNVAAVAQREQQQGNEAETKAPPHSTATTTAAAEAPTRQTSSSTPQSNHSTACRGPPRVPLISPSADADADAKGTGVASDNDAAHPGWSGPMHAHARSDPPQPPPSSSSPSALPNTFSGAGAVAVSTPHLHPQPGAPISEFDREDVIRSTDALVSQLAHETAALAARHGVTSSADIAALCRRRGLDYVDAGFLPVTATLGLAAGGCRGYDPDRGTAYVVQWCSRDAFLARGRRAELLTSAGVDPNALRCGALGDSGVVAALAALAEAAGAVTSVLASTTSESEANGLYVVWLCVRGWWTRATVDAYLPCVCEPDGRVTLYGCRNVTTHDLWAPMCEKALAKVYGAYAALPRLSADVVLAHLTGGPVECWDWWRQRSDEALAEIEAALTTNARGAGMVMLTTHTTPTAAMSCHRLGLLPATSYRVLAVSESADGEPMLLLRNWAAGVTHSAEKEGGLASFTAAEATMTGGIVQQRNVSPLRDDPDGQLLRFASSSDDVDALECDSRGGSGGRGEATGCLWLRYNTEVLPLFDRCHVCFDCRRYHDARVPIEFAGSAPAVPTRLIRVRLLTHRGEARLQSSATAPQPTRLWIGLHQPSPTSMSARPASALTATSAAPLPPPWALTLTLMGQEEAPTLSRGQQTRPARRSYVLSESFMGEPQVLPAVWMYLELDAQDLHGAAGSTTEDAGDDGEEGEGAVMEFYVVPHMERTETLDVSGRIDGGPSARSPWLRAGVGGPLSDCGTFSSSSSFSSSPGGATTAVVAVLAECRDAVAVDVVAAPEELRAALYHDVVDRIDFAECPVVRDRSDRRGGRGAAHAEATTTRASDVRCQLNGRCLPEYAW